MELENLRRYLDSTRQTLAVGRTVHLESVLFHLMGFTLDDKGRLHLLTLEYNEAFHRWAEEARAAGKVNYYENPPTNRAERLAQAMRPRHLGFGISAVAQGGMRLVSRSGSGGPCDLKEYRRSALFTRFLLAGWDCADVAHLPGDYTVLSDRVLEGTFDAIPFSGDKVFYFTVKPDSRSLLVEQPVTLSVGDSGQRLDFTTSDGKPHTLYIERVSLLDMSREMEKAFAAIASERSKAEAAEQQQHFEQSFAPICPPGMCFPLVEYTCEEDLTPEFCLRDFLEAPPVHSGGAMGFILDQPKGTGHQGLPLRQALLQQSAPPDAALLDAELLTCQFPEPERAIII